MWFGGGKLASDLSLPRLRQRWQPLATPGHETGNGIAAAADLLASSLRRPAGRLLPARCARRPATWPAPRRTIPPPADPRSWLS